MNPINRANIRTRADGRYDFDIIAGENGNVLCGSNQGYETRSECVDMAKRILFGPADPVLTFDAEVV